MKILITGGAGYIGSHVLKLFLENTKDELFVIDNLYSGSLQAIEDLQKIRNFTFIKEDLGKFAELEKIFAKEKFDAILHFAAYIEVFESTQKPLKYYRNNTANLLNIMELCDKFQVKKFIFSSTAATYGEPLLEENALIDENFPQLPINPYGKSKLMSETIIKDYAEANPNFNYAILRYFNVAGASKDGKIGQNYPNATHLIKVCVQTITKQREEMSIFGDDYATKDGTCIRDYIHVEDLAEAHLQALNFIEEKSENAIFNVGYGKGYSVKEVIEAAKKVSQNDFKVNLAPKRAGDPANLVSNPEKLKKLTKWQAKNEDLEFIIKTALLWEEKIK